MTDTDKGGTVRQIDAHKQTRTVQQIQTHMITQLRTGRKTDRERDSYREIRLRPTHKTEQRDKKYYKG